MDYCRLYASMRDDPKMLELPDRAFRRHIETMCWVTQHETNGFVPKGLVAESVARRLVGAGLWDVVGKGYIIHNWLNRQRSKEEMDAKRIAGRKASRIRWGNGSPDTALYTEVEEEVEREEELEVEVASLREAPKANTADRQLAELLLDASGRAIQMLDKLKTSQPAWNDISNAVLMKLGRKYGAAALLDALTELRAGEAIPFKAYPYLESICIRKVAERAS